MHHHGGAGQCLLACWLVGLMRLWLADDDLDVVSIAVTGSWMILAGLSWQNNNPVKVSDLLDLLYLASASEASVIQ